MDFTNEDGYNQLLFDYALVGMQCSGHGMSPVLGFLQVFVSGGLKVVLWKAKEELGVDEEIGSFGRYCGGSERVGRGGEGDGGEGA